MKEQKILIIYNSIEYLVPFIEKKGYKVSKVYKDIPIYLKALRKLMFMLNLPFYNIWFKDWFKDLESYDKVIFFSTNPIEALDYIKKRYPKKEVIYWYWNPIGKSLSPETIKNKGAIPWTFDKMDAEKYKVKLNSTFYLNNISLDKKSYKYDFYFLGLDKGRRETLNHLEQTINSYNLSSQFYIVDDEAYNSKYNGDRPFITYEKYLENLVQTKVIVDIMQNGQTGLTVRPMESIYFKKKLITDNKEIINEPLYNVKNIFIIGIDDFNSLKEFVNSPYIENEENILEYYDFDSWITRFK